MGILVEPTIKERFHEGVLNQARERFGISRSSIELLDGFESFIFEYRKDGRDCILRISHSFRRTINMIRGELDWISYLAAGGAGVARPILSEDGQHVETIDDGMGGRFLATAFEKAPGRPSWEADFWNRHDLFEKYGRLIGRMHALSKDYVPADPAWKRPDWDAPGNLDLERWLPSTESAVLERFRELMFHLRGLPRDSSSFGLIHQDAHAANFFVDDDGRLTLFDFDDCVYGWYVYDLAMVLFYAVTNRPDSGEFGPSFWRQFMRGYDSENQLDSIWFNQIPYFLKLREIDLYGVIHRSFDLDALKADKWVAQFMKGRKRKIENNIPYVSFDL